MKTEEKKTAEEKNSTPFPPRDPLQPPSRPEASEPTLDERISALQQRIDKVLVEEKRADHWAIFELAELKVKRSELNDELTQEK